ncbi:MAG: RnfABCDGE type electron transport complex subunit G [Eubacteriales bacterium]|nr:RnfABCDGE type electron transport complex subunit G [Eubacteriales bacterium]
MSNEAVKNTIILFVITLLAGLLLGGVYEITKNPIAAERKKTKENAYKEVFQDADTFHELEISDQIVKDIKQEGMDADIDEIMEAVDQSNNVIGYVLTVTDHEGYGGDVQFAMGVKEDGTLNAISFLSISETAGLGMKAKEDTFKNQFSDKNVDSFVYTKNGASAENEIDAISGATITTNAVTNGVNAGLRYVRTIK